MAGAPTQTSTRDLLEPLAEHVGRLLPELVELRRDLHAHPELGGAEVRTTARVAERLTAAGLEPRLLPGTGLVCDIGDADAPALALRADLDALPVQETSGVAWASTTDGVAHACGHDVHVVAVLGAGLLLAEASARGDLRGRVRLVFQPSEEVTPGGATDVVAAGGLDGVDRILALHCDPRLDVGLVGLRTGPITSASDHVLVRLRGDGGHTSRPFLTQDLVYALAQVVVQVPSVLTRRLDPRSGANLTWGRVVSGTAPNAIPSAGEVEGTLRVLDAAAWELAGEIVEQAVHDVVAPYGARAEVVLTRSVPPVVNDADSVALLREAAAAVLGEDAVAETEQSLGGEDFGWYQRLVPGALARLGTRTPGGPTHDLHQGDFSPDERALGVGVRLLAASALRLPGA